MACLINGTTIRMCGTYLADQALDEILRASCGHKKGKLLVSPLLLWDGVQRRDKDNSLLKMV